MSCTINASVTSTGLIHSADATGNLELQGNGTTGLTVNNSGKVVIANTALSTASAGTLEYDGGELYFTPLGTQRGIVPSMQYYRLNSGVVGTNTTGAQSIFGVGVTLSASMVYEFEYVFSMAKTAGTTSHTVSIGYGGTATVNNFLVTALTQYNTANLTTAAPALFYSTAVSQTVWTSAMTTASMTVIQIGKGTVSVNAGGTFIPQYSLSAAPGGAYTTQPGSYFKIYPIGSAGSNTSIGTWA
jgi:hypothetical protein